MTAVSACDCALDEQCRFGENKQLNRPMFDCDHWQLSNIVGLYHPICKYLRVLKKCRPIVSRCWYGVFMCMCPKIGRAPRFTATGRAGSASATDSPLPYEGEWGKLKLKRFYVRERWLWSMRWFILSHYPDREKEWNERIYGHCDHVSFPVAWRHYTWRAQWLTSYQTDNGKSGLAMTC